MSEISSANQYVLYVTRNLKVHSLPFLKATVTCLYFKPQFWVQTSRSTLRDILILSLYLRLCLPGGSVIISGTNET